MHITQKNMVRKLSIEDLNIAMDIMVEAFHEDPLWLYLIPNEKKREIFQRKFFKTLITLQFNNLEYYGISNPLKGITLWGIPNPPKISKRQNLRLLLKSGLIKLLFSRFIIYFFKVISVFLRFEVLHRKFALDPHYYLSSIAVRPQYQGEGLASKLINTILLKADQESMSAYTETVTPRNVPIYQYFGFEIMEKVEFPKKNLAVWSLYRPAKNYYNLQNNLDPKSHYERDPNIL